MSNFRKWQSVLRQVRLITADLPSPEEKAEILRGIADIIDVLNALGKSLGGLPTSAEADYAKAALEKLEYILGRNPLLRGGSPRPKKRIAPKLATPADKPALPSIPKEDILREIENLSRLPEDKLRTTLQQERYSKGLLRLMLNELGRRVPVKATRKEMAEQLAVALINRQTYEGLRGSYLDRS